MIRIVPGERLLWAAGLVFVPFLTAWGMGANDAVVGAPFIAALICFAWYDAVRGRANIAAMSVALPNRLNLFMGRPTEIEVRLQHPAARARAIRVGLNFPREIKTEFETMDVALPENTEHSALRWKCQSDQRGIFQIPSAHIEIASPAHFWNVRLSQKTDSEVRVYPDLLTERKNLAAVFMRRGFFGARAQRMVGKGRDFEKLREYVQGDPMDDVHWKASAKRGRLVTKVFQIERTQEVYVAIDCSRLSNRASSEKTRSISTLDRFISTALLIGLVTQQQSDHFGLITFSDHVHSLIRARNGKAHFGLCRDALFNIEPRLVTPDYDDLFSTIRLRLRKRALILVLTALDDPLLAESYGKALDLVNRQHLIITAMIEPGKVEPMFKAPAESADAVYDSLAGHMIWQKLREVEKMLAWRGVRFSVLGNEALAPAVISQYLEVKQRQML